MSKPNVFSMIDAMDYTGYLEPVSKSASNEYDIIVSNVKTPEEENTPTVTAIRATENQRQRKHFKTVIFLLTVIVTLSAVAVVYAILKQGLISLQQRLDEYQNDVTFAAELSKLEDKIIKIQRLIPGCDAGWMSLFPHCYYFAKEQLSWINAQNKCKSMSADLVKIDSRLQNQNLIGIIKDLGFELRSYWIGLSDIQTESNFKWVSDNSPAFFTDWHVNEPNNDHDQDCARLWAVYSLQWDDYHCSKHQYFICENTAAGNKT